MLQSPPDLPVRSDVDYDFLSQAMAALSNPVRLRLLGYLMQPHYLEEIASHLKMSRQAARKHLDQLVELGILERREAIRETGRVAEFMVSPRALFLIHDEFLKLGCLRARVAEDLVGTRPFGGDGGAPAPPTGPCLTMVHGFQTGRRFPLVHHAERVWRIGRDPQCEVMVSPDPFASNRHAEVQWRVGGFVLVDLASTNGTTRNWEPVPRAGSVPLRHGDVVGVGKTLLLFTLPEGAR